MPDGHLQAARPRSLRSNSAVAQPDSAATRRAAAPEKMALRQRKGLASSLARSKPGADDEGPPRGGEGRDALVLAALLVCFVGLPVLALTLHGGGEIPNWVLQLIASSLAVLIAEISTLPFDVAKVRLQLSTATLSQAAADQALAVTGPPAMRQQTFHGCV